MLIYDISQKIFGCKVYPGDPIPQKEVLSSIENGDLYNLTSFSMCAHNGTHVDSPFHFIKNGNTVDEIPLYKFVGMCYVAEFDGNITESDVNNLMNKLDAEACKRLLFKGSCTITSEAAKELVKHGVILVGNESQTVGPEDAPMAVHLELLKNDVVILEGIRLDRVNEGKYFLCAAPLCLNEADGAPCRAILIDFAE